MKNQPTYNLDEDLLRKYLSGDLSTDEIKELEKILDSDPAARQYLAQMEKIWKSSSSIGEIQSIDKEGDWKAISSRFGKSAHSGQDQSGTAPENETTSVRSLNPARTMVFRIARIAAVFIMVSLAAYMLYYFNGNGVMSKITWTTAYAELVQEEVTLADGSIITLNTGSSLVYPSRYKRNERKVSLKGEAFFEIARDEKRPFLVNVADQATVEVLGTSFNLRQDPKNRKVFLNVLTGKVAFYSKDNKDDAKVLEKNEQAVYENGSIQQSASFNLNFLSWKTRTLEFENTPLPEVIEELERHYRIKFHLADNTLDTLSLTGIYKNQEMEDVIEEIGLVLDLEFRDEGGLIEVSSLNNVVMTE